MSNRIEEELVYPITPRKDGTNDFNDVEEYLQPFYSSNIIQNVQVQNKSDKAIPVTMSGASGTDLTGFNVVTETITSTITPGSNVINITNLQNALTNDGSFSAGDVVRIHALRLKLDCETGNGFIRTSSDIVDRQGQSFFIINGLRYYAEQGKNVFNDTFIIGTATESTGRNEPGQSPGVIDHSIIFLDYLYTYDERDNLQFGLQNDGSETLSIKLETEYLIERVHSA